MNKFKFLLGLFVYKITPSRKKNKIVFTSFDGHYSDNTKAISEKFHESHPEYELVWLLKPEYFKNAPGYVKKVDINSLKSFRERGAASAQVDNVYGFRAIFKNSKNPIKAIKRRFIVFMTYKRKQPVFATMHGTSVKKIGRDQIGNTIYDFSCKNTFLLLGNKFTADILRHVTFGRVPTIAIGAPRNDILFCKSSVGKSAIGVDENKKIVLYAPTFRNDGKDVDNKNTDRSGLNQLEELKVDELFAALRRRFGGEWVMICRFHYHIAKNIDWEKLNFEYGGKIINGNRLDDMADYLPLTDVLISDYSSCMHDFALTEKPCFIYAPDIVNYGTKERGFYIPLEDLPYPLAINSRQLIDNILKFDDKRYERNVDDFMKKIGSEDDGKASERVVDFIIKKINNGNDRL